MKRSSTYGLGVLLIAAVTVAWIRSPAGEAPVFRVPGLEASVQVSESPDDAPLIQAFSDRDAVFVLGWLHARDRLFQMDSARRLFSGRLAELLGEQAVQSDILLRTVGLRRAAEASLPAYSGELRSLFEAYAAGVNAYLADESRPLPPEYQALELTSVEPWTALDSVTIAKGQAFALSFDDVDLELTAGLEAFEAAGTAGGFDGATLFFQDLYRSAPFDPAVSIPGFPLPPAAQATTRRRPSTRHLRPQTVRMARELVRHWRSDLYLGPLLAQRDKGSNWWVIAGSNTDTGFPMLANDPHLTLDAPPIFYEAHLLVADDPRNGPMNVTGVSFAGTPLIAQGCNTRICWGSTVNPMDVTDFYEEAVLVNPFNLTGDTIFEGELEPLTVIPQSFRFNQVGNGVNDDLAESDVGPLDGGLTFLVPRRNNGPIVDVDASNLPNVTAISVQYTGFGPTLEGEAFWRIARAGSVNDFREALQYFDIGSQNFAYADVDGNIAYFTSAELPLREDLQTLGGADGAVPFLVRDGTHIRRNEWLPVQNPQFAQAIPFEILPFDEMPQVVNPASGFVLSANNDPVGTTLDNDVLNSARAGGGIYYLSPGYASLRMGRIAREIDRLLADGGTISMDEMMALQSNNQLLDPEIFVPFIEQALANAAASQTSEALMELAADAGVVEAVNRLGDWDFSTPTGIQAGFDPGDDPDDLPAPVQAEIDASVAATIYALWRARFVNNTIDDTLARVGLEGTGPPTQLALSALRNLLEGFEANQGAGAAGVNFFEADDADTPEDARDLLILRSVRQALDLAASDEFAPAFGNSTDQSDYRWGQLHRIVMDHPLGGPFNLPDGINFSNLSPDLRGVARSGGLGAVDASSHNARAQRLDSFMFGSGPARRFVGELRPDGIRAYQVIPGGRSGVPGDPRRDEQLGRWLTNRYHRLSLLPEDFPGGGAPTLSLAPAEYRLWFPFLEGGAGNFTGFAVSNRLDTLLELAFQFLDAAGQPSDFPLNPAVVDLAGGSQAARLGTDLAGLDPGAAQGGWVELNATPTAGQVAGPALASFTQFGSFALDQLDGSVALDRASKKLYFTRVAEGPRGFRDRPATTSVSLANPGEAEIEVELELRVLSRGTTPAGSPPDVLLRRTVRIPGRGLLRGTLSELFEQEVDVSFGLLTARVTGSGGVVGFELVRLAGARTLLGLNASDGSGRSEFFSAQLASGGGIFTNLTLLNTADRDREVTLTAVDDQGTPLAADVVLNLSVGEIIQSDAGELFGLLAPAGAGPVEGSIRISADGDGVIGDVVFGDAGELRYAAALALQDRPFRRAIFSQVANTPVFFTGLALFNAGAAAADVLIEVFDDSGQLTGSTSLVLTPGQRTSQLLPELVPASAGQQGGYVVLTSDQPIVAQQLFGTFSLSLLSAVPPTVVE